MAWHFDAAPQVFRTLRTHNEFESNLFHVSGGPSVAGIWQKKTPGMPWLINGSKFYEYGALHFSYLLDAYIVEYGGLHFSYLLGGIVDAILDMGTISLTDAYLRIAEFDARSPNVAAITSLASVSTMVDRGIGDVITVADVVTLNITFDTLIQDSIAILAFVTPAGAPYPAWAVNLGNMAPSRYENFNFNSFGKIGDYEFAANGDGLFMLGGADDNGTPINASIMLGRDMRKNTQMKRSNRAYLHGTSDNKVEVRIIDENHNVYAYQSDMALKDVVTAQRVTLGRGLDAIYWQMEVRNIDGGDFEIERIEFLSLNTARKFRR